MSGPKRTPGPWRLLARDGETIVAGPNDEYIAFISVGEHPDDANGKLIAAAPRLVEALERLLDLVDKLYPDGFPEGFWPYETVAAARAALREAGAHMSADLASPACSNCGDDNGLYIGLAHTHLCRECITHAVKHLPTLDIPSPARSLARDVAAAFGIEETPEMVGSLSHFLRHITYEEALDAIAITMSKGIKGHDAFRYFCGICWNWIRPGRNT